LKRPGRRLWRLATSVRTTVALLVLLAVMLTLNVTLPQAAVLGPEEFARVALSDPGARFVLVTLGLGFLSTSPIFVAVLVLFFLNLTAVLTARAGPTWRRTRFRPRPVRTLEAWAKAEPGLGAPLSPDDTPERFLRRAVETLRGFGFRVHRSGDRALQGIKHRLAPLGFLLFHLSFFLLCAGGILLYLTRFVATTVVVEDQEPTDLAAEAQVLRRPPWGRPPEIRLSVTSVETRLEDGQPVHLGATLRFPAGAPQRARINHPAHWGSATVLVQEAGLAPVLWLQDARGFSRDRVVVAATTRGEEPTRVPLGPRRAEDPAGTTYELDGELEAVIHPLGPEADFPSREELPATGLYIQVLDGDEVVFDGRLQPGGAAALPEGRLVFEELRYWLRVMVVSEVGGGWLIAGFLLGVTGLIWRLGAYRREVALLWTEERFTLVGRSEYYSHRFQDELSALFEALRAGDEDGSNREPERRVEEPREAGTVERRG